jgi:hypothetical protein
MRSERASDGGFTSLSCPSTSFCAGIEGGFEVLTSTHPTKPHSWRRVAGRSGEGLNALSCPSRSLCVAAGYGPVGSPDGFISANPAGGPHAWTPVAIDKRIHKPCFGLHSTCSPGVYALACPSALLCLAADQDGHVIVGAHRANRRIPSDKKRMVR